MQQNSFFQRLIGKYSTKMIKYLDIDMLEITLLIKFDLGSLTGALYKSISERH